MSTQNNPNNYTGVTLDNIVGTAVGPAEDKFNGSRTEVTLAVNFGFKDKQTGEWKDTGSGFFRYGASGEWANPLREIQKGDRVRLDDVKFEIREYDKKDGGKGVEYSLSFAKNVQVVKKAGSGNGNGGGNFAPDTAGTDAPW